MIYLLTGENTDEAVLKLRGIRAAFARKNVAGPIAEIEGTETTDADVCAVIGAGSLFSKNRLIVFKRMGSASALVQQAITDHREALQRSGDVFVFWETDAKSELCVLLKKHATKSQTVDKKTGAETSSPRANVFLAVDRILEKPASSSAVSAEALRSIEAPDILHALFWKLKTVFLTAHGEEGTLKPFVARQARIAGRLFGNNAVKEIFFAGIVADAAARKDGKYAREHLERLIFSLEGRQGAI